MRRRLPKLKKRGRPSKFNSAIKKTILFLAMKGFTDDEIAKVIRVTVTTLNNWKNVYPDFFDDLKGNKLLADVEVEKSMFERACGYEHPEDKIFCVAGKVTIVPTIKHYPPDPICCIFWLKNRQPDNWKDRIDKTAITDPITLNMNFGSKKEQNGN